jgi:hypothetical protein
MSAVPPGDDDGVMTVMTLSEQAAVLQRLVEACTTSVVAPVGPPRNRLGLTTRSLIMWRFP